MNDESLRNPNALHAEIAAIRARLDYLSNQLNADATVHYALHTAAKWLGDVTEPLTEAEQQRYDAEVFPSLDEQVRELNGRELCELVSDAMPASDKRDAMLYMNDE